VFACLHTWARSTRYTFSQHRPCCFRSSKRMVKVLAADGGGTGRDRTGTGRCERGSHGDCHRLVIRVAFFHPLHQLARSHPADHCYGKCNPSRLPFGSRVAVGKPRRGRHGGVDTHVPPAIPRFTQHNTHRADALTPARSKCSRTPSGLLAIAPASLWHVHASVSWHNVSRCVQTEELSQPGPIAEPCECLSNLLQLRIPEFLSQRRQLLDHQATDADQGAKRKSWACCCRCKRCCLDPGEHVRSPASKG
jgi:hypothetical protein